MEDNKILTPTNYKRKLNFNYKNDTALRSGLNNNLWCCSTIKKILTNEVYIGNLVQGRERKISYKSKHVVSVPKDEWIIVKKNHEPIISEDDFYAVQERIKNRKTLSGDRFVSKAHCFAGIIKCMDCGFSMVKDGRNGMLRCFGNKKSRRALCSPHYINFTEVEEAVKLEMFKLINEIKGFEREFERAYTNILKGSLEESNLEEKINLKKIQIEKFENGLKNLYLDKVQMIISAEEYSEYKRDFYEKLNKEKDDLKRLEDEKDLFYKNKRVKKTLTEYQKELELTNELVSDFIEKLYIGEKEDNGNRRLVINWNV